jgi:hypothetical protein
MEPIIKRSPMQGIMRIRLFFFLTTVITFAGCVTSPDVVTLIGYGSANQIKFSEYKFDDEKFLALLKNKTVYVAPVKKVSFVYGNFIDVYDTIQSEVETYMKNNGFNVLPSNDFENIYNAILSSFGGIFNEQTGEIDNKKMNDALLKTSIELLKTNKYSAVVMPVIAYNYLPLKKPYTNGEWDGVKRHVTIKTVTGLTFTSIATMSINILVVTPEGGMIFQRKGGIDFIQKVRETGKISEPSISLLTKESKDFDTKDIREGIEVAFHPLIYSSRIAAEIEKMKGTKQ